MLEVEGPDGTIIEFPEGTDQTTIKRVMAKRYGAPMTPEQKAAADRRDIAGQFAERSGLPQIPEITRGLPFIGGLLDEGAAAVQSGLSYLTGGRLGEDYDTALVAERETERRQAERAPVTKMAGEIATGFAGAAPFISTGRRIADYAANVALGGGMAAASGFTRADPGTESNAENFDQRLSSAGYAAPVGAGIAALGPLAFGAIGAGSSAVGNVVRPRLNQLRGRVGETADEVLAAQIQRSGQTPQDIQAELDAARESARFGSNSRAPMDITIADVNDSTRRLASSTYRQGGRAGEEIEEFVQRRQRGPENKLSRVQDTTGPQGLAANVTEGLERALGIRTAAGANRTMSDIIRDQRDEGNRLYRVAFRQQEEFNIDRPIQAAGLRAQQYQGETRNRLERAINLFTREDLPINELRRFDNAKKELDDMINTAQRAGENNIVRELADFKTALIGAVERGGKNQAYTQARQAWGTQAERREALELGRNAFREDSEVTAEVFNNLTPGNQQLFRIGLRDAVRRQLERKKPGDDITRLFDEPRTQELLRAAIPNSRRASDTFGDRSGRFGEFVRNQQRQVQTRNEVIGNSKTAQRLQDDVRFAGDMVSSALQSLRGGANIVFEAVTVGLQRALGFNQAVSTQIARRLIETNPDEQRRILARVMDRMSRRHRRVFTQNLSRALSVAPTGQLEGENDGAVSP